MNRYLWKPYLKLLLQYPLTTKSVSTSVLMGPVGDSLAQILEYKYSKKRDGEEDGKREFKYNYNRMLTMSAVGLCFSGPVLHYWYQSLDKIVTGQGKIIYLKKMLVDQLVFAPCVISTFMLIMNVLNGRTLTDAKKQIKNELLYPALAYNWCLWPAAQYISFAIVPLNFRVLYVSVVSVFWNIFLSNLGNK
ncbi:pmp22 family protein [Tieghemostelium lacteum]|uniref:Pmp22 family protein n=1 Tax=Tieghemostelium lacteum TaxID=361077 RepID=A0A152A406_TIELA|nr:pmp22 family protein [Tieghemostelium lacteum]|eukprot:KYR00993.1 pmp22 family protein [Tieghemostelium lacteum]